MAHVVNECSKVSQMETWWGSKSSTLETLWKVRVRESKAVAWEHTGVAESDTGKILWDYPIQTYNKHKSGLLVAD